MRKIDKIIIHCSVSSFGDVATITDWHIERGFNTIGYHYVILNGNRKKDSYNQLEDGLIEHGRDVAVVGAHVRSDNATSIGICMIGNSDFSIHQFNSLDNLLKELMERYEIFPTRVIGHNETVSGLAQSKTCPNFDVEKIRFKL